MKNKAVEKAIKNAGGQSSLSKASGISQAAIHKLLTGKTLDMRVGTAKALSKASGVPIEEFIK
ncbi:MAG: helix-turn-helix domain-containing protein [Methylococcaceae bacterium]